MSNRKLYYNLENGKFYVSNSPISGLIETNIDPIYIGYVLASEYQEEENGVMVTKYSFAVDEGQRNADLAAQAAQRQAIERYNQLNSEILQDAAIASGTTNVVSAITDILTYMRMSQKPELFDQEGIVAKKSVAQFQQGDPLDNELKVRQYAEAMMAETDSFFITRLKKITDYILEE